MALSSFPTVVTRDLLFCYDMNNTGKSWLGAPTVNRVTPTWASWGIDGSGTVNIGTRTILSDWHCRINDYGHNTRQSIYVTGLSASTTYIFSVKFKKLEGAPTLRFQLQSYNGGTYLGAVFPTTVQLGLTDKEGWQTAYYSYTTAAGADRVLWFMQDGDDYTTYTHSFELKEPQCEQQSFVTPFVSGTRSNTQALVDLTGLSTPTLTSLTYTSDNTFSFDGSTNYITAGALTGSFANFTVNVWLYSTSVSNYRNVIDCNFNYNATTGNIGPRLEQDSTGKIVWILSGNTASNSLYDTYNVISSGMQANRWYNIVVTRGPGNLISTYLNGNVVTNQAANSQGFVNTFGNVVIGKGFHLDAASTRSFTGKIPTVMIYNRALSAVEIKQNFNAHRGRYGL